jgi:hypothetical protein
MLVLAAMAALAAPPAASADGYVELRGSYSTGVDGVPYQLVERVRPELTLPLSDRVILGTTVEGSLVEGRNLQTELQRAIDDSELGEFLTTYYGCTWPDDPKNRLFRVDTADDYLAVDRLYVDVYEKDFDLRVGRQALQWGSALLMHPTDPFPEVLFVEPWRERTGVNAARVTVPYGKGESDAFQAVVASDDAFTTGRAAARITKNLAETDFSLVGAYRGDDTSGLAGVDIKGTAILGFWLEGALHVDPDLDKPVSDEVAVGLDYSFPVLESLYIAGQYYRNGAGITDPDDYNTVSRTSQSIEPPTCDAPEDPTAFDPNQAFAGSGSDPFAPFTIGRDYALAQVALDATKDVRFAVTGLHNLRDGSGVVIPYVQVTPSGAVSISATAQLTYRVGRQRTGEFKPALPYQTLAFPVSGVGYVKADLSGVAPDATFVVWTRANF